MSDKSFFGNLFGHYLSGSGKDVDIDINDLDNDSWYNDFRKSPQFQQVLKDVQKRQSPDPVFVKIPNVVIEPPMYKNDFLGIGRYKVDFTGNLKAYDHIWDFRGDATGSNDPVYGQGVDRYDFDAKKDRKPLAEFTTSVGRTIGSAFNAKNYSIKIKNYRRYQQNGNY